MKPLTFLGKSWEMDQGAHHRPPIFDVEKHGKEVINRRIYFKNAETNPIDPLGLAKATSSNCIDQCNKERNQSSGQFFLKSNFLGCPKDLPEVVALHQYKSVTAQNLKDLQHVLIIICLPSLVQSKSSSLFAYFFAVD